MVIGLLWVILLWWILFNLASSCSAWLSSAANVFPQVCMYIRSMYVFLIIPWTIVNLLISQVWCITCHVLFEWWQASALVLKTTNSNWNCTNGSIDIHWLWHVFKRLPCSSIKQANRTFDTWMPCKLLNSLFAFGWDPSCYGGIICDGCHLELFNCICAIFAIKGFTKIKL